MTNKTQHVHTCMRCGKRWNCPNPDMCKAGDNAFPRIILPGPDGPQFFDHSCIDDSRSEDEGRKG